MQTSTLCVIWFPLQCAAGKKTLKALCFMNPYVLAILTAIQDNRIYRKVLTYSSSVMSAQTHTCASAETRAHEALHTHTHC